MNRVNNDRGVKNLNKTFVIEIKSNQNQTWQGSVTWVEEQKKECFRSALELIRMMDSTIEHDD